MKVKIRKPFRSILGFTIPPIFYALILDGIDVVAAPINTFLISVGGAGLATDLAVDGLQSMLAFAIFEDLDFAIIPGAGEAVLPSFLDLFPSFTVMVWYKENSGGKRK